MIPHKHTDQLAAQLAGYRVALVVAVLAAAGFGFGWYTAPERLWIDFPPALSQGGALQPGLRHPHNVYLFAWLMASKLNQWDHNGAADFPNAIEGYRRFLTPKGEAQMVELLKCKTRLRELTGRRRNTNLVSFYTPQAVQTLSDKAWLVTLELEVFERIGDMMTKQPRLTLQIYVADYRSDPLGNPWHLGFAGYANLADIMGGRCHES